MKHLLDAMTFIVFLFLVFGLPGLTALYVDWKRRGGWWFK